MQCNIFSDNANHYFFLHGWIAEPVLRGRLIHELNMHVYKVFQQEGIEIPYPKRDVYVRELPRES